MNASDVFKTLQKDKTDFSDFTLSGISVDSRLAGKGYCFVAVCGTKSDGHDFILAAIEKGAKLIVYQNEIKEDIIKGREDIVFIKVSDSRKALALIASEYFGNPNKQMVSIGITGTNGKTTVSYLIEHILSHNGIKSGLIGTIEYRVSDHVITAINTTPDAIKIQHLLHHMAGHGLSHNIMEVSSHALDQNRAYGIDFKTAVFTNLTHDHLDYHKDLDKYFKAKSVLFESLDKKANAVINADDQYADRLISLTQAKVMTYSIIRDNSDLKAEQINLGIEKTEFMLNYKNESYKIESPLIGRHNVYNLLAAIGAALAEGIDIENIITAALDLPQVRGRLERISSDKRFQVFIDYAHTDDALKNVLNTLKELNPRKIITVFGCGGNRDKKKRKLMGNIASKMSDIVVLTNDNPRKEDPQTIIDQIVSGFEPGFKDYEIIADRKKAIEKACCLADEGDFVLIAGKGHEQTQVFKDRTIEFDDKKIVQEYLAK